MDGKDVKFEDVFPNQGKPIQTIGWEDPELHVNCGEMCPYKAIKEDK